MRSREITTTEHSSFFVDRAGAHDSAASSGALLDGALVFLPADLEVCMEAPSDAAETEAEIVLVRMIIGGHHTGLYASQSATDCRLLAEVLIKAADIIEANAAAQAAAAIARARGGDAPA